MAQLARQTKAIARPLKTLVPLIGAELQAGDQAGLEHYRRAGELLLEAREQVATFKWTAWLSKNFALSKITAWRYMKLAEEAERRDSRFMQETSIKRAIGEPLHDAETRRGEYRPIRDFTARIDTERVGQERQIYRDEITLHREIAEELIDIGYKAMATRLHPDKGGSIDAMRRLNRVRDELKAVAESRRFV